MIGRHLTGVRDLSVTDAIDLFRLAGCLRSRDLAECAQIMRDLVVATVFFQPSTRTRLGFELSAARLGATALALGDMGASRAATSTSESFDDTLKVIDQMADVVVLRHFVSGAARRAASVCAGHVVNAGDGSNEHPTQALGDVWLMVERLGGIEGATVGLVGDPGARVLRSLALLLAKLRVGTICYMVPPIFGATRVAVDGLVHSTLPDDVQQALEQNGVKHEFYADIEDLLGVADVIEMMPFQIPSLEAEPRSLSEPPPITPEPFRLTAKKVAASGSNALIMHPGPRYDELSPDTDGLPTSLYFEQVHQNNLMRMAVLAAVTGRAEAVS